MWFHDSQRLLRRGERGDQAGISANSNCCARIVAGLTQVEVEVKLRASTRAVCAQSQHISPLVNLRVKWPHFGHL